MYNHLLLTHTMFQMSHAISESLVLL
eukprot:COSAG01_NODE_44791_length_415_cov_2.357595_1_plen_25_part_01